MNKVFKYILFRAALVIITLHTIIPHPHSDKLTKEKHFELHKESNSFIGFLRFVFHESDDENLDNLIFAKYEGVKKIDKKYRYPKVSIFNNTHAVIDKKETEKIIKCNTNNLDILLFVKLNRLRGPPLLT